MHASRYLIYKSPITMVINDRYHVAQVGKE